MSPAAPFYAGAMVAFVALLFGFLADGHAAKFAGRYAKPYPADETAITDLMMTHFAWASDLTGGSFAPLGAVVGATVAAKSGQSATFALLIAVMVSVLLFVVALLGGPRKYEDFREKWTFKLPPLGLVGLVVNLGLAIALDSGVSL